MIRTWYRHYPCVSSGIFFVYRCLSLCCCFFFFLKKKTWFLWCLMIYLGRTERPHLFSDGQPDEPSSKRCSPNIYNQHRCGSLELLILSQRYVNHETSGMKFITTVAISCYQVAISTPLSNFWQYNSILSGIETIFDGSKTGPWSRPLCWKVTTWHVGWSLYNWLVVWNMFYFSR